MLALALIAYILVFGLDVVWASPLARALRVSPAHSAHPNALEASGSVLVALALIGIPLAVWIWLAYVSAKPWPLPWPVNLAGFVIFSILWVWFTFGTPPHWFYTSATAADLYKGLVYLFLLYASAFLGLLIARAFRDVNLVAAGVIAGGLVDYWGVYAPHGTTRSIIETMPALHHHVSVHLPHVFVPRVGPVDPMVGPGDYVFVGIMLAAVHKFQLQPRRTAILMWALLFAAMAAVVFKNWSVPAIVPMSIAVLAPNWRSFKFKRDELFALCYAAILLGVVALVWSNLHSK